MGIWDKIIKDNSSAKVEKKVTEDKVEEIDIKEIECIIYEYNFNIQRLKKADAYIENKDIPMEQIEKHLTSYFEVIRKLSMLKIEYENKTSIKMTNEQVLEGFK